MFEQAESPVSRDLINIDLHIKGDPYWLEPAPVRMGTPPSSQFRRLMANRGINPDATEGGSTGTNPNFMDLNEISVANTAEHEVLMVFRSFTPQEFDPETGLTPAGKKSSNVLNGVYGVRMVTHSFSGGEFKQRLQGLRDINTNLRNVDLFANLKDQPEDSAAESTDAQTDTESSSTAQGAANIVDATITLTNVTQERIDTVANLINPNNTFGTGLATNTIGPVDTSPLGTVNYNPLGDGGPRITPIAGTSIGVTVPEGGSTSTGRSSAGTGRRYGRRIGGRRFAINDGRFNIP